MSTDFYKLGAGGAPAPGATPAAPGATPPPRPRGPSLLQRIFQPSSAAPISGRMWPGGPTQKPGQSALDAIEATPQYQRWAHPAPLTAAERKQYGPEIAAEESQVPSPAQDFMSHVQNVFEGPLTEVGAAQMDTLRAKQDPSYRATADAANRALADSYGVLSDPVKAATWKQRVPAKSYLGHALALMNAKQYGVAADMYSTTSVLANRTRAAMGDPGAKWFEKHPTFFSGAALGEEFANPMNIGTGEAFKGAIGARTMRGPGVVNRWSDLRTAGVEAPAQVAAAPSQQAESIARSQAAREAQAARQEQASAAQRFAQFQRDWAQRSRVPALPPGEEGLFREPTTPGPAPRALTGGRPIPPAEAPPPMAEGTIAAPGARLEQELRAPVPVGEPYTPREPSTALVPQPQAPQVPPDHDVADRLERIGRQMQVLMGTAKREGQNAARATYGGLTHEQQLAQFDAMQGEGFLTPEMKQRLVPLGVLNRVFNDTLQDYGIAQPEELRASRYGHSQAGSTYNPKTESLDDAKRAQSAPWGAKSAWGTKGTIGKPRVYKTRQEAIRNGEVENPEWSAPEVLENQIASRAALLISEAGTRAMAAEGVMVPREINGVTQPRPQGWHTIDDDPDLRELGSPTLRSSYYHPNVAKTLRDLTAQGINPQSLVSTPLHGVPEMARWANIVMSRMETMFGPYHMLVNVVPNQLATVWSQAPNKMRALATYLREWARPNAADLAKEEGVSQEYASDVPEHLMTRPFRDLNASERGQRLWNMFKRYTELGVIPGTGPKALYEWFEPRSTHATYQALKAGGVPEDRAYILTRQTVGEPENMPAAARGAQGQAFQFPGWRLGMARLWPYLLGSAPALYMGPQRAARAYNISRGAYDTGAGQTGPPPTSYGHLIPELYAGTDKNGIPQFRTIPSAANLPLEAIDVLGNAIGGASGALLGQRYAFGDPTQARTGAARLFLDVLNPLYATGARGLMTEAGQAGEPATGEGGYRLWDKDAPSRQVAQQILMAALARYSPVMMDPSATGPPRITAPMTPQGIAGSVLGVGQFPELPTGIAHWRTAIEDAYRPYIRQYKNLAKQAAATGNPDAADAYNQAAAEFYDRMEEMLQSQGAQP